MSLKKYLYNNTFLAVAGLFVLFSCDVQKRKYTKGYYFNQITQSEEKKSTNTSHESIDRTSEVVASTSNEIQLPLNQNACFTNVQSCDTIVLYDDTKMPVIIVSVGDTKIFYRSCDGSQEGNMSIETAAVKHIHYADGNKISFDKIPEEPKTKPFRTYSEYKSNEAEDGLNDLNNAYKWLSYSLFFSPVIFVGLYYLLKARKKLKGKPGYERKYRLANTLSIVFGVLSALILIIFGYIIYLFSMI